MNDIQLTDAQKINSLATDDLKKLLGDSLEFTAKHLVYMGLIWKELESRGEDLSELRAGLGMYIPMVAYDKIDAHLVIRYAGQKTLLTALAEIPIEQQKELKNNDVVSFFDGKTKETKKVSLIDLSAADVQQVFSKNGVREVNDQERLINRNSLKPNRKPQKKYRSSKNIRIDDSKLVISGSGADIDLVLKTLSDHFDTDIQQLIDNSREGSNE